MFQKLSSLIAPHYCCSCGQIGRSLCDYCKYNIINELPGVCIICARPTPSSQALCTTCNAPYTRAWCAGEKSAELEKLIERYKFHRDKTSVAIVAELLVNATPALPTDCVVTWVPTIRRHVRLRGYDHARELAVLFARHKGVPVEASLIRAANSVQRGASKRVRQLQAQKAFSAPLVKNQIYVLIDDVYTTGATVRYASQRLLEAGAREVWVVVAARQPLEK
jgi:ComF family protein